MQSSYSFEKANPDKETSSHKFYLSDFLDVPKNQEELNKTLLIEYFIKVKRWNLGLSLEGQYTALFFLFFVSCAVSIMSFFLGFMNYRIHDNFDSLFMWTMGAMPFTLIFIYFVKTRNNFFTYHNISLRDKSPENIQKIYEVFSIFLNNELKKDSFSGEYTRVRKEDVYKKLALALTKKYFLFSPVLSVFKDVEKEKSESFEKYWSAEKAIKLEQDKNNAINGQLKIMSTSSEDIRRDILMKALESMK